MNKELIWLAEALGLSKKIIDACAEDGHLSGAIFSMIQGERGVYPSSISQPDDEINDLNLSCGMFCHWSQDLVECEYGSEKHRMIMKRVLSPLIKEKNDKLSS